MKEIGQILKSAREAKNIPLDEVALATKINTKILKALEEGDLEKLPAKAFIRGFIQTYAKFLHLDEREILSKFQEKLGSTKPQQAIVVPETPQEEVERNLPGSGRRMIIVGAIVVSIIGIIIIQRVLSQKEAEMKNGDVQAITGSDAPLNIKSSASPAAGVSQPPSNSPALAAAVALPSPTPVPTPTPAPTPPKTKQKPTPTPRPKPSPTPRATPTPVPQTTTTSSPAAPNGSAATTAPTAEASPAEQKPQEIIVEALDHVTIRVNIDNQPQQEVIMNADQIQTFKAKGRIKLFTPNGGAISVIHNGEDLGVPGNLSQPKTMVFPR